MKSSTSINEKLQGYVIMTLFNKIKCMFNKSARTKEQIERQAEIDVQPYIKGIDCDKERLKHLNHRVFDFYLDTIQNNLLEFGIEENPDNFKYKYCLKSAKYDFCIFYRLYSITWAGNDIGILGQLNVSLLDDFPYELHFGEEDDNTGIDADQLKRLYKLHNMLMLYQNKVMASEKTKKYAEKVEKILGVCCR